MAPVLDATLGGAASNSYITLAEATAIAANEPFADEWAATSDDTLVVALLTATRWLETLTYKGSRCTATQRLKWPRSGAVCDGVTSDCSSIPFDIQEAEVILAWTWVKYPDQFPGASSGGATQTGTYVKRNKLGDLEQEFDVYPAGTGSESCDTCGQPAIIKAFPWLTDLLGCWAETTTSENKILLRVRS